MRRIYGHAGRRIARWVASSTLSIPLSETWTVRTCLRITFGSCFNDQSFTYSFLQASALISTSVSSRVTHGTCPHLARVSSRHLVFVSWQNRRVASIGQHVRVFTRGTAPRNPITRFGCQGTLYLFYHNQAKTEREEMFMKGDESPYFRELVTTL